MDPNNRVGDAIDPNMIFRDNLYKIFDQELKNIRLMTIDQEFKTKLKKIIQGH